MVNILDNKLNFILGGKREKKLEEPKLEATSGDYMMAEMVNMAIDFEEERLHKRVLMIRIAKEA